MWIEEETSLDAIISERALEITRRYKSAAELAIESETMRSMLADCEIPVYDASRRSRTGTVQRIELCKSAYLSFATSRNLKPG